MQYDFLLIGTGQATGTIIGELVSQGKKIAVAEMDNAGGTCVNWGCTPTKTLIASSRDAHMVRRAGDFGIKVDGFSTDFPRIMERVNSVRHSSSQGMESWLRDVSDYHKGGARFLDSHTVDVGGTEISARQILIHTGTRSAMPEIPGINSVPCLDNRGILDMDELPPHLLIIGSSYIALEFAQAFRRLGSDVSVIGRGGRILSKEDDDIASLALDILTKEGIVFQLDSDIQKIEPDTGGGVRICLKGKKSEKTLSGSHLLVATGRLPNTEILDLQKAGVLTDSRGYISVNDFCQTSVPHVFAIGDVNGRGAFTHTAVHDGQVFLDYMAGGLKRISDRRSIYSMFIDPPLARVGISETEARKSAKPVLMATMPMSSISRAKEKAETDGMIKILVDPLTQLILGATVLGVGGDEIIGMLALAIQAKIPYKTIQNTVLPHPTVSELIPWVFDRLKPLE